MTYLSIEQVQLVNKYRYLPYSIAKKNGTALSSAYRLDVEDLAQEGFLSLCKAAKGYDSSKNTSFMAYAYKSIDNAIKRLINRNIFAVSYPVNVLEKKYSKLTSRREPRHLKAFCKFNQGFGRPMEIREAINVPAPDEIPDDKVDYRYIVKLVKRALNKMPPERALILKQRFGIDEYTTPISCTELAKLYHITEHSVYERIYVAKKHFRKIVGEQIDFYI